MRRELTNIDEIPFPLLALVVLLAIVLTGLVGAHGVTPRAPTVARQFSPDQIARRVAAVYGEQHPRLLHVEATTTDNNFEPMYFVVMEGRFVEAHAVAHYLEFSALADRYFVWGRRGYDDPQLPLFVDDTNLGHL